MGQQDAQQVCLNGHQITDSYHRSREFRQRHCSQCGAETIHQCQSCGIEIRGDYHVEGFLALGDPTPSPRIARGVAHSFRGRRESKSWLHLPATPPLMGSSSLSIFAAASTWLRSSSVTGTTTENRSSLETNTTYKISFMRC